MAKPQAGKPKNEPSEFYQIRINHELKNQFMQNCKEMALNPSAVMRKLMSQWTKENSPAQATLTKNK